MRDRRRRPLTRLHKSGTSGRAGLLAFELVRSGYDRGNFLLTKEAKIIAMTCTHAALKRREVGGPGARSRVAGSLVRDVGAKC